MKSLRRLAARGLLLGATALVAPGASAVVISATITPSPTKSPIYPDYYAWAFWVTFSEDTYSGSFITFYDLPESPYTVSPTVSASASNTGLTPAGVSPTDDPALRNLTFTLNTKDFTPAAPFFLGTAYLSVNQFDTIEYAGLHVLTNNTAQTATVGTIDGSTTGSVPEPSPGALLALGSLGLFAAVRGRRRASAPVENSVGRPTV
ncbi:MAG: hypothetical protein EHM83_09600 [Burkholderiales bacterium]|nr:MAG: hypothetical protein EHM83_09600 [Burkholderiales bacterium]